MIDLYFWPTPNGKKITILLEEAAIPYKIKAIHIGRGDQLTPDFLKISPNGRMPAIVDHDPIGGGSPLAIFESGAIMEYLAEKSGKFWPKEPHKKYEVAQWMYWQMANQGPKMGEQGHFRRTANGREKRRSGLRVAALRQRSPSHLRSDESRTAQKEISRCGRIHDRRHDLLSVGDNLAESQSRSQRISQRQALA